MTATLLPPPIEVQAEEEPDTGIQPFRWTRTDVYRALDLGFFAPDVKMELIEGELIQKMPQNNPHVTAIIKGQRLLSAAFGLECHLRSQAPMWIDEENEPEPDLMVVNGDVDDYTDHPRAADVRLVVEVSDTTLRQDRTTKVRLYARAGVVEYWVLVLRTRTLEVRREPMELPEGFGYASLTIHRETDTVTPLLAPQATLLVADLLPRTAETSST